MLYGTTYQGGSYNKGTIFSFDITTNTCTKLHDFSGINGAYPQRGLTQGSNGKLYGTTVSGGANNNGGVAFRYTPATGNYYKLADFGNGILGSNPDCNLVETPILTTSITTVNPVSGTGVYPNPATTSLTVTGSSKDDVVQFTDLSGKEILLLKINANSKTDVDISGFPNVFFIKGQNGEARKIVKE